jgi:hypothetical protein
MIKGRRNQTCQTEAELKVECLAEAVNTCLVSLAFEQNTRFKIRLQPPGKMSWHYTTVLK